MSISHNLKINLPSPNNLRREYEENLILGTTLVHTHSYSGTTYFGQLSHCLSTHFNSGKMKLETLEHIILSIASLGFEYKVLLLENKTDLYCCLLREYLALQDIKVFCNCLVCIKNLQPHIYLYLGVTFFNCTGSKDLKIVSLTSILLLFHTQVRQLYN